MTRMIYETYNVGKVHFLCLVKACLSVKLGVVVTVKNGKLDVLKARALQTFRDVSRPTVYAIQAGMDVFLALAMDATQGGSRNGLSAALQDVTSHQSFTQATNCTLHFE